MSDYTPNRSYRSTGAVSSPAVAGNASGGSPADLEALTRALRLRDETLRLQDGARAASIQHDNHRREVEAEGTALAVAVVSGEDTLTRQQARLNTGKRELAELAAERTRVVMAKQTAVEEEERNLSSVHKQLQDSDKTVADLEAKTAAARAQLAEAQVRVEAKHQQAAASARQLAETERRLESVRGATAARVEAEAGERAATEQRVLSLERESGRRNDEARMAVTALVPLESAHLERKEKSRRETNALHSRMDEQQAMLDASRRLVAEQAKDQDQQALRRRKADEEEARDAVASRRQALQALESDGADRERKLRGETETAVAALQAKLDATAALLPQVREEVNDLFAEELRQQDALARAKRDALGVAAAQERIATAAEQRESLAGANDDLRDRVEVSKAAGEDRARRIRVFEDAVAPLQDVEAACTEQSLQAKRSTQALADGEAEMAVWRAQAEERIAAAQDDLTAARRDAEVAKAAEAEERRRIGGEAASLENEGKRLQAQVEEMAARVKEAQARTEALDNTLEHVARQRRAMAEEMAHRRDSARAAAASLLSQLE